MPLCASLIHPMLIEVFTSGNDGKGHPLRFSFWKGHQIRWDDVALKLRKTLGSFAILYEGDVFDTFL